MSRTGAVLAVLGLTMLGTGGCGTERSPAAGGTASSTATQPTGDPDPATATTDDADGSGALVVSLTLVQSGGIAGTDSVTTIRRGTPGAAQVLALAAELASQGIPPHTEIPCCDMARYELTVRHADGTTVRVVTYDGDDSRAHAVVQEVQRLAGTARDGG